MLRAWAIFGSAGPGVPRQHPSPHAGSAYRALPEMPPVVGELAPEVFARAVSQVAVGQPHAPGAAYWKEPSPVFTPPWGTEATWVATTTCGA